MTLKIAISRTVSQVSRLVYMTFTYINRSHGKTISRTVSQVSRLLIVYMTFTYISRSQGKTSLIFNSTVVRNTYLLPYYSAYNLTVKRCLLEYRSNQYLLTIARSLMTRIYDTH